MKTGITIMAFITAKAGMQPQVREVLLDLVAQTRKEKGCLNYDLHQSQDNPREFVMYENWESAADLDAHARSEHLQAFGKAAKGLLERPAEITKWDMVSDLAGR
ncbi:MAG TPA: putative quinol monooxygenase [Candidatus Acidoferrales bacterium]|nr:putative quinol monooxygenase [Candidatus Acidoferrales bacterium]